MTNVIRPTFGNVKLSEPEARPSGWHPVERLGGAAGHFVGFSRAIASEGEGSVRLVIWPASGRYIETVSSFADQSDAVAAAALIVRALEIIEGGKPLPTA